MNNNIMEIIEAISNYVNGNKFVPCSKEELVKHFASYYDKNLVEEAITTMLNRYQLIQTNRKNIQSAASSGIFVGEVVGVNNESVYIRTPNRNEDFRIRRKPYELILPKSIIVFKAFDFEGRDGELIKVLKENNSTLVGEIVVEGYSSGKYEYYIKPQSKRIGYKLKLDKKDCKDFVDGHKVIYTLESVNGEIKASVSKIIGHKNDVGVDITSLAIEADVPIEFSSEALKQAEETPNEVREEDFVNRDDYTGDDHLIITIDGADTKDRDDAYEIVKEGNILHVSVHIADVAYYVKKGSPIYNDALERGTSCYLADRVIPMLPRKLSNGICSLDPNVNRLAMSYKFDIDEFGEVSNFSVKPSVIRSRKAFTYDEVQNIIEGDIETINANKEFIELMNLSIEASDRLSHRKEKNGELRLDAREAKLIVDENGHAIDIKVREQRKAERIIEDLMVATNEAGARYVCDLGLAFLFRNHEDPNFEKLIENFIPICKSLKIRPNFRNDNFSYEFKRIMSLVEDETVKDCLKDAFLRCLAKANYGPDEIGHFGLGLDYYAQLTSPIRRLPDLIDEYILHMICELETKPENYNEILNMYGELVKLGLSTSSQERRADQLERDVFKMKAAELMNKYVGQEYVASVSGFSKNGLFVKLDNTIEGFIPFKSMKGDMYFYNDDMKMAVGKRSGESFAIGNKLNVRLTKASKEESQIDFAYLSRVCKNGVGNKKSKGRG